MRLCADFRIRHAEFLPMAGAPSQLELFDYKPELQKLNGEPCPPSFLEGKRFAFIGFIRGEAKFDSVEALVARMNEDVAEARRMLAEV